MQPRLYSRHSVYKNELASFALKEHVGGVKSRELELSADAKITLPTDNLAVVLCMETVMQM